MDNFPGETKRRILTTRIYISCYIIWNVLYFSILGWMQEYEKHHSRHSTKQKWVILKVSIGQVILSYIPLTIQSRIETCYMGKLVEPSQVVAQQVLYLSSILKDNKREIETFIYIIMHIRFRWDKWVYSTTIIIIIIILFKKVTTLPIRVFY